jgi:prolyl-tRNA synthetase
VNNCGFSVSKSPTRLDIVSPLSITESTFSQATTVLDSTIASSSSSVFAVRANSSRETIFLSGKDLVAYLKNLETGEIKVQELDIASLATGTVSHKPPVKEKEDAKIEGAVQIAIGVKKEVDFSSWYTNVRFILGLASSLKQFFRC